MLWCCCSLSSASGLLLGGCYSTSCGHVRFKVSNLIILKWSWLTQMYWLNFKHHTWSLKKKNYQLQKHLSVSQIFVQDHIVKLHKNLNCQVSNGHFLIGLLGVWPPSSTRWNERWPLLTWIISSLSSDCALDHWHSSILSSPPVKRSSTIPCRKGLLLWLTGGGVNRPYTNFKKHTPFVLDRWLQCFIVNVWMIWMNGQRRLERMICCVVCFFVLQMADISI